MFSIIFTSTDADDLRGDDIERMIVEVREESRRSELTGMLARRGKHWFGILEGPTESVFAQFERMLRDPRHVDVQRIEAATISARSFPGWIISLEAGDPLRERLPGTSTLVSPTRDDDRANAEPWVRALADWLRTLSGPTPGGADALDAVRVRDRVTDAAITVVRRTGVHRSTMALVALEAGISADVLHRHFPNRASLLAETVERWTDTLTRPLGWLLEGRGAVAFMHVLIGVYASEPAFMRLLSTELGASADDSYEGAEYYRALYLRFRTAIRDALEQDVLHGREPDTMDPERAAQQLLALWDGLRMESLLVPGTDVVEAFDRAATRMRRGWSETYRRAEVLDIPLEDGVAPAA